MIFYDFQALGFKRIIRGIISNLPAIIPTICTILTIGDRAASLLTEIKEGPILPTAENIVE